MAQKACNLATTSIFVPIVLVIFFLLVISLLLILNYWFYNVTKRCYTYLKDFEEHRKIHGSVEVEGSALP